MASLDIALLTGRSSLLMQQTKLATTANNIANADTVGYHRQTVTGTSAPAVTTATSWTGTGVRIENVTRAYDEALERNLREMNRQDGYYQTYAGQIEMVEGVLAPQGESTLAAAMAEFAASLSALDASPASTAVRATVIARGSALVGEINSTRGNLVKLQQSIVGPTGRGELADTVGQANQLASRIASLNQQIVAAEQRTFNPQQANDLRDQREALAGELSRLVDMSVTEEADGSLTIDIDGTPLVAGAAAGSLAVQTTPAGAAVVWKDTGMAVPQDGGAIQGLIDADAYVRSSIAAIDDFAAALAGTMNAQHAAGYDRLGIAGGDLFDAGTPGKVAFLVHDPSQFAASAVAGQTANSDNARALHEALAGGLASLAGDNLLERPDRIVDSVALDAASARSLADGTEAGIAMFETAISRASGVNLDEELMAMIEVQRAYQAAARFVGVVDELLATVVQLGN
ncbi:MAG: flagellar hook-associated protein FlgK [Lentisphaeria bacterium]|jgi:flagellar hook-associated protein 1 FlgK|nr:flagellar hook-associated protein FlgK [Lentisphaeria bacterium]